jgi:hypothetical protein
VYTHELKQDPGPDTAINEDPPVDEADQEPPDAFLINAAREAVLIHFPLVIFAKFCLRTLNDQPIWPTLSTRYLIKKPHQGNP